MSPVNPYEAVRGTGRMRKLTELSNRSPDELRLEADVQALRRKRRRALLRRIFRLPA